MCKLTHMDMQTDRWTDTGRDIVASAIKQIATIKTLLPKIEFLPRFLFLKVLFLAYQEFLACFIHWRLDTLFFQWDLILGEQSNLENNDDSQNRVIAEYFCVKDFYSILIFRHLMGEKQKWKLCFFLYEKLIHEFVYFFR